jgi:hypothetical protein
MLELNKEDSAMRNHRLLPLAITLVSVFVELAHAGSSDPEVAQPQGIQGRDGSPEYLYDPVIAPNPNMMVWVSMRSKAKRSASYVLKQLQSAATSNGMSCELQENESSQLLCQFQGPLYNAISARDVGTKTLGIQFYYLDDEGEQIDPARQATINSIIHRFASALKQSRHVIEIEQCSFPHRECKPL